MTAAMRAKGGREGGSEGHRRGGGEAEAERARVAEAEVEAKVAQVRGQHGPTEQGRTTKENKREDESASEHDLRKLNLGNEITEKDLLEKIKTEGGFSDDHDDSIIGYLRSKESIDTLHGNSEDYIVNQVIQKMKPVVDDPDDGPDDNQGGGAGDIEKGKGFAEGVLFGIPEKYINDSSELINKIKGTATSEVKLFLEDISENNNVKGTAISLMTTGNVNNLKEEMEKIKEKAKEKAKLLAESTVEQVKTAASEAVKESSAAQNLVKKGQQVMASGLDTAGSALMTGATTVGAQAPTKAAVAGIAGMGLKEAAKAIEPKPGGGGGGKTYKRKKSKNKRKNKRKTKKKTKNGKRKNKKISKKKTLRNKFKKNYSSNKSSRSIENKTKKKKSKKKTKRK